MTSRKVRVCGRKEVLSLVFFIILANTRGTLPYAAAKKKKVSHVTQLTKSQRQLAARFWVFVVIHKLLLVDMAHFVNALS